MKFVTAIINGFAIKEGTSKAGKPYTLFYFSAHETDVTGARIPCEIITGDGQARDILAKHLNTGDELQVPFSRTDTFAGKPQYNVDSVITRPDFDLVR